MNIIFEHYENNDRILIVHTFGELLGRNKKNAKSLPQSNH